MVSYIVHTSLYPRESQSHKCHLTSKLNFKTVHVLRSLIFYFHPIPSPVHSIRFSCCFFPGFFAIFILLSSKNNIFIHSFAQVYIIFPYICFNTVESINCINFIYLRKFIIKLQSFDFKVVVGLLDRINISYQKKSQKTL